MATPFLISGLPLEPFAPLFNLSDVELAARDARRSTADSHPSYPCRVSLQDAVIGEELILLHHAHHPVRGPYHGSGPIYVRVGARPAHLEVNQVPEVVRTRLMSIRAYDAAGLMVSCDIAPGAEIEEPIRLSVRLSRRLLAPAQRQARLL
jgi:hypothetical protein